MRVLLCFADTASTHQRVMVQQQVAAPTLTGLTEALHPRMHGSVFSNYSSSVEEELL